MCATPFYCLIAFMHAMRCGLHACDYCLLATPLYTVNDILAMQRYVIWNKIKHCRSTNYKYSEWQVILNKIAKILKIVQVWKLSTSKICMHTMSIMLCCQLCSTLIHRSMNQEMLERTSVIKVGTMKNTDDFYNAKEAIPPNWHFSLSEEITKEETGKCTKNVCI